MHIYADNQLTLPSSVVSIGAFDGMHRGHQALIKYSVARARKLDVPAVVYTFDPPPRAHFQNSVVLTTIEEKVKLIRQLGADYTIVAQFNDEYASRPPTSFIKEMAFLRPEEIRVGPNFQFGKEKQGDVELLSEYFNVYVLPFVTCDEGKRISSTRVRELLQKDEWKKACHLIGREQLESF
ncbi:FAD synthetase family protein [Salibacterium aidingense]|uniref:FAD synthetase family protein n=1 Tax=Salibacterium aidingense TaxID=384933 RepID=UPI0004244F27|nr:FAD synthetase family protein [Salibacterium aidingense]